MAYTEKEKKEHITEIQQYLMEISYVDENIPRVIPDGIYGPETRMAVEAFQRSNGLPVTGTVDEETWDKIYYVRNLIIKSRKVVSISPFASACLVLSEGDRGDLVFIIQAMLNTISHYFINLNHPEPTGVIDKITVDTIKTIQHISGENETGNIDSQTWNSLARLFDIYNLKTFNNNQIVNNVNNSNADSNISSKINNDMDIDFIKRAVLNSGENVG